MNIKLDTIKVLLAILSCGVCKLPVFYGTEKTMVNEDDFKQDKYCDEKNGNKNISTSNYQVEEPQSNNKNTEVSKVEEIRAVDISKLLQKQKMMAMQDLSIILSEYSPDSKDQFTMRVFEVITNMHSEIEEKLSLLHRQHILKVDKLEKIIKDNQYNYNNKLFQHAQTTQQYKMAVDTSFDTQAKLVSLKLEQLEHNFENLKESNENRFNITDLKKKNLEKKLEQCEKVASNIANPFQQLSCALENLHSIIVTKK